MARQDHLSASVFGCGVWVGVWFIGEAQINAHQGSLIKCCAPSVGRPARNVVEAASNGAIAAIKVVASVAANLIAIIGLIAFFNATLSYLGARVGYPQLTFQVQRRTKSQHQRLHNHII